MQAADRSAKKPAPAAKPARAARAANGGGGFTFAMDESEDDRDADFQR